VDAGVVAALLTVIASLVGVLAVGFFQLRAARSEREAEAEKVLGRYRRPLAAAAFDLQRRLFNIIDPDPGFLGAYMTRRNEREIDAVETVPRFPRAGRDPRRR